jgi:hypothetical protein
VDTDFGSTIDVLFIAERRAIIMPDGFSIPEAEMTADPNARARPFAFLARSRFEEVGSRKIQDDRVYRQAG